MLNSRLTLLAERQMLLSMHYSVGDNPTKLMTGFDRTPKGLPRNIDMTKLQITNNFTL